MNRHQILDVRDGIQYDMHLHGSRFIIVEFAVCAVVAALVLLASVNLALHTSEWPWWLAPWLVVDAGFIGNCATVWHLARQIARTEGARPQPPDHPHITHDIWTLPLLVVIPVALPLLAWHQRNQ